jgi:GDP-mannose 6-dehydrogenase
MKISIFGLGYVGCVTAACLASNRHEVIGVDSDRRKVKQIQAARSTVLEPLLPDLVKSTVAAGRLRATTSFAEAVAGSDMSLICAGTPSSDNGCIDLRHLETVCQQIGSSLHAKTTRHLVVLRSTVTPGTTESVVIPVLEKASHRSVGDAFGLCVNPEFMREGSSVQDFHNPPFTIIGEYSTEDGDRLVDLYSFLQGPFLRTNLRAAESVKLVSNAFHALKIGFSNEIGNFCHILGIDSHEVMDIFCRDRVLNISPKYLKPGFAFGGSCLPKDLSALLYEAERHDVELPIIRSILPSNRLQITRALDMIASLGRNRVGLVGLSFKEGTDDLRQSPMVQLAELLIGKGYDLKIYDPLVRLSTIVGSNRRYIRGELPHIAAVMTTSFGALCRHAAILVLGQDATRWRHCEEHFRSDHIIVDLVRVKRPGVLKGSYRGLCW